MSGELMTDGRPKRRSKRSLRRRAYKYVARRELDDPHNRQLRDAWLAGYEAARRDARRDK